MDELEMQLARLARLGDGWDSYGARRPTAAALEVAGRLSLSVLPTNVGGLVVSLEGPCVDVDVEIGPDGTVQVVPTDPV